MKAFGLLDDALQLIDEEFKPVQFELETLKGYDDPLNIKQVGLVPSTKNIFFLLHDILFETYQLIPNLYNADNIEEEIKYKTQHSTIFSLLFTLSTWVYSKNEQNIINTSRILDYCVNQTHSLSELHIESSIIDEIAQYAVFHHFEFDKNILESHNVTQLTFNAPYNDTITFSNAYNDFINIISNEPVLDDECRNYCILDTFVMGKGDEMWLSLINKSDYRQGVWMRTDENRKSISYYGGRERDIYNYVDNKIQYGVGAGWDCGFGSIQSMNKVLKKRLPWYSKYDWITMYVDNTREYIYFYKNCIVIAKLKNVLSKLGNNLYYMVMVDDKIDHLFVERAINM